MFITKAVVSKPLFYFEGKIGEPMVYLFMHVSFGSRHCYSSERIASNEGWQVNYELEITWKKALLILFKVQSKNLCRRTKLQSE
jgi:hypothetical protein